MKYRELVYMCLDEIKLSSDDSYITEDHILFLISKYRSFLLGQKYAKTNMPVSRENYQTISAKYPVIPLILQIAKPEVYTSQNGKKQHYTYVSPHRFNYVGDSKYLKNIKYCTIDDQHNLLTKPLCEGDLYITAVFADIVEVSKYNKTGWEHILDDVCPIESELVSGVQELVVKDVLGMAYRPQDKANNASDELGSVGMLSGNPKNNK